MSEIDRRTFLGGLGAASALTIVPRRVLGGAGYTPPAPITGVINHVSYGIDNWNTEAVKSELERRGLKPRPDMVGDNFKSFHVKDPDGWDLQISNKTKG